MSECPNLNARANLNPEASLNVPSPHFTQLLTSPRLRSSPALLLNHRFPARAPLVQFTDFGEPADFGKP
jgi:hypothetical protein